MDQRARGRIAEGEEGVRNEGRARCLCLLKGQPGRQLASSRELTSDSAPEHTSRNRGGAGDQNRTGCWSRVTCLPSSWRARLSSCSLFKPSWRLRAVRLPRLPTDGNLHSDAFYFLWILHLKTFIQVTFILISSSHGHRPWHLRWPHS